MNQIRTIAALILLTVIAGACQTVNSQYSIVGKWQSDEVQNQIKGTAIPGTPDSPFWYFEFTETGQIKVSNGDFFTVEGQYELDGGNRIQLSGDIEIFLGKTIYYKFIDGNTLELNYPGMGFLNLHKVE